jgi:hypothetical protein
MTVSARTVPRDRIAFPETASAARRCGYPGSDYQRDAQVPDKPADAVFPGTRLMVNVIPLGGAA